MIKIDSSLKERKSSLNLFRSLEMKGEWFLKDTTSPFLSKVGTFFKGNKLLTELFCVLASRLHVWFSMGYVREGEE